MPRRRSRHIEQLADCKSVRKEPKRLSMKRKEALALPAFSQDKARVNDKALLEGLILAQDERWRRA